MTTLPQGDTPRQIPLFDPIEIPLTRGYVAIVDPVDSDLTAIKWYAVCPAKAYSFYAVRIKGRTLLHRIIMARILERPLAKGEYVDHVNGDGLDNRRANLRVATQSQNLLNSRLRSDNTSGYKGVSLYKRYGTWQARIKVYGRKIHLGYFDTPEAAHAAYMEAARKYAGEFARAK